MPIAVNVSAATAFADGLTHSQHEELMAALLDMTEQKTLLMSGVLPA